MKIKTITDRQDRVVEKKYNAIKGTAEFHCKHVESQKLIVKNISINGWIKKCRWMNKDTLII